MIPEPERLVIGFTAFGGVVGFLPLVLLGMLTVKNILRGVAAFLVIIVISALFCLLITGANVLDILSLRVDNYFLPRRIFSVSYTMIVTMLVLLPVAMMRTVIKKSGRKE